jgi:hypothetical protein
MQWINTFYDFPNFLLILFQAQRRGPEVNTTPASLGNPSGLIVLVNLLCSSNGATISRRNTLW